MNYDLIPIPTERRVPSPSWRPPADVRMISADDHNMEAEHLWEERLPAKFRDRAPKNWRDPSGAWLPVYGLVDVGPSGSCAVATMRQRPSISRNW